MAQQTINNGESGLVVRTKLNENFTEVYGAIDLLATSAITGAAALSASDLGKLHICTGTTVDYAVTLPAVSGQAGKSIAFKGSSALTRVVTITRNSADTIDGEATRLIASAGVLVLVCDGTNWHVVHEVGSWIPYTVTWGGFSVNPANTPKYFRQGKSITVSIPLQSAASNATSFTATLPFTSLFALYGVTMGFDNTSTGVYVRFTVNAGSTTITFFTSAAGGAWTASNNKGAALHLTYEKS